MTELFSINLLSNGQSYSWDDGDPFGLLSEDGLMAHAPVTRVTERGAQQHGDTDIGFFIDPRIVQVVIGIFSTDGDAFWRRRNTLLTALAPYNNPSLEMILSNGDVRQLDCYLTGTMTMGSKERSALAQEVGITLRAPDPSLYDPTAVDVTFALGGGGGTMEVPTEVPTEIGASEINVTQSVSYTGTWYAFPVIRIEGPITDCRITNETTGEKLDFDGVTIIDGDYYIIDTRYGRKSVVDSTGANKISGLTDDSDLATFHLEPAGSISPVGENSIRVEGSALDANTVIYMTYHRRYLGI